MALNGESFPIPKPSKTIRTVREWADMGVFYGRMPRIYKAFVGEQGENEGVIPANPNGMAREDCGSLGATLVRIRKVFAFPMARRSENQGLMIIPAHK